MSLEELRKKRMEELMRMQQQKAGQEQNEQAKLSQQIEMMEETVRQYLSKDALVRYGTLKTAHQEKAIHLLIVLFQAIQKGQAPRQIDDNMLRKLLEQLTPKKREMKIKRV